MCNFKFSSSHIRKVKIKKINALIQYILNIIWTSNQYKINIFYILFYTKCLKSDMQFIFIAHLYLH